MKLRRIITLLLTVLMIFMSASVSADNVSQIIGEGNTVLFIDVPDNYWARDQINYFAQQGIVDGYEDGTFKPEGGVTREEFCKLLVSTFNQPLEMPNCPSFADVSYDRWSYPYVEVCKEFLTGYANPFGGLPSFHPEEMATREDISVALVRMMGFTDRDVYDRNYAAWKFKDGKSISPNLVAYVSLACEKGLINGDPEGTFRPTSGITRAETVVLLNRATKQAVTNINAELELSANVYYSNDGKTATINILAEEGTTVTVDGENIKMDSDYSGHYKGVYIHTFEDEGSERFVIEGTKGGKSKTTVVTATYKTSSPIITMLNCPETSASDEVNVIGMVTDAHTESKDILMIVNGEKIRVAYDGSWEKKVKLTAGENKITISATNGLMQTSNEIRIIRFDVDAPVLKITECPEKTEEDSVRIEGTVSDKMVNKDKWEDVDDIVDVKVNGKTVYIYSSGEWSERIDLKEGENVITVVATNKYGKTTAEKRVIVYEKPGPDLEITNCPDEVDNPYVVIEGEITDSRYYIYESKKATVTVNGKSVNVNSWGEWSIEVPLKKGANEIVITAEYKTGGKTVVTRTVTYNQNEPELTVYDCPSETDEETIEISGEVDDKYCFPYQVNLTVNGKRVYDIELDGSWSVPVTLKEGKNEIIIVATNQQNVSKTVKKVVTYNTDEPEADAEVEDVEDIEDIEDEE